MRPLRLTMQAFGSYGDPESIDFTDLGDHRLFLIHGPTGSGKTTVLDAICFALYGVATGADREAKGFRSDFASPQDITEVTLDFEIGSREFRILRRPEQERAKKRGEGTTTSPVAATMWERTGASDSDEGTVLASKWTDVTSKVEELLGFRSEQFRQVIVLPQGRFRDLLMASSNDREAILQQLFDTSFYKKIQISLKERAKLLAGEIKDQRTRRSILLDQCDCEDETDLAEVLTELDKDLEAQTKEAKAIAVKSKAAEKKLNVASSLEKRFLMQDQIAAATAEFEKQSAVIDVDRTTMDLARKAAALADLFATVKRARDKKLDAAKSLKAAKEMLKNCKAVQEKAAEDLLTHQGKEGERKALAQKLTELERIRPLVATLARERTDHEKLGQEFASADKMLADRRTDNSALEGDIEKSNAQIEKIKKSLRDRELLERVLKEASEKLATSGVLIEKRQALLEAGKALEANSAEAKKKSTQLKNHREHFQRLIDQRQAGSAAMLARDLKPGDACPVCGSKDHPQLAASAEEIPDAKAVDAARRLIEEAERASEKEDKNVAKAEKLHAGLKGELETLLKTAGDLDEGDERLTAAVAKAQQGIDKNERLSIQIDKESARLAELEKARRKNELAIEELQKQHGDLGKRLSASEARLEEKMKSVGKVFENEAAVDAATRKAEQLLQKSRQELEAALKNERDASSDTVKAETALKHARKEDASAQKEVVNKNKQWKERLKKSGFKSEEDFVAAELDEEEIEELRSKIEAYDHGYGEAKVRTRDMAAELKDKKRPDVAALQKAADALEAGRAEAEATVVAIREKIKILTRTRKDLEKLAKDLSALDEKYGVLGTLANTADGQNSLRVSLQRFVLATRLDDALIAASQRLSRMTNGRFRIQRNTTAADKRAAGGLELEVEDAYTASCRPVSTLSGGESFQAALSLALGLSEVVQAYAGGIRLDTIFVDEGFGSLDPEALELAINTLIDLQATGRLVGVISHVPELKERIDVRLQIKTGKSGSTAAFQLP